MSSKLSKAARRKLSDDIDALLPQWQCGQCGFGACKPYAEALAAGSAEINQCPPGGERGVRELAKLLLREFKPLSAEYPANPSKAAALIDERICIGCTLCIQACPVDAIVGAAQQMHTVVAKLCTGCALCLPPCPVDCIAMMAVPSTPRSINDDFTAQREEQQARDAARERFELRALRLARAQKEKAQRLAAKASSVDARDKRERQALIAAAMERARAQRQEATVPQPGVEPDIESR